jgi:uncharacterized membrane protein
MTAHEVASAHGVALRRLFVAGCAGVIVLVATLATLPWQVAMLAAWDTTAAVVVIWIFAAVWGCNSEETHAHAMREDSSRASAEITLILAAVVSLVGTALALLKASSESGPAEAATTGVAVLTVVLSWAVVNAIYALRYAHLYYDEGGGIEFDDADGSKPDYRDFLYMTVTIGMTYQISDTDVTSKRIRRTVTGHALLSYLFGTGVVAMMINVVAGLLK